MNAECRCTTCRDIAREDAEFARLARWELTHTAFDVPPVSLDAVLEESSDTLPPYDTLPDLVDRLTEAHALTSARAAMHDALRIPE